MILGISYGYFFFLNEQEGRRTTGTNVWGRRTVGINTRGEEENGWNKHTGRG